MLSRVTDAFIYAIKTEIKGIKNPEWVNWQVKGYRIRAQRIETSTAAVKINKRANVMPVLSVARIYRNKTRRH